MVHFLWVLRLVTPAARVYQLSTVWWERPSLMEMRDGIPADGVHKQAVGMQIKENYKIV